MKSKFETPRDEALPEYIGRTMEVPGGKQRIEKIVRGDKPDSFIVTLTGWDSDGNKIYTDDAELPLAIIEQLYN